MRINYTVKKFEEVIQKVQYTKKIKKKDFLHSGDYPIISQEKELINGYWNNSEDVYFLKKPVVIFGDHTKVIKYIDFVLGADGVKIFEPIDGVIPKYLFYVLHNTRIEDLGYSRHYRLLKTKRIPLPPLPEQRRIVAALDQAFEAIDQARKNTEKNLENINNLFISFLEKIEFVRIPLGNVVNITTGKLNANAAVDNGLYPFFTCARKIFSINEFAFNCEAILLAGNNASGDFNVKHYSGKFNAYQRTYVITEKKQNTFYLRYLYYELSKRLKELKKSSVGVGTKFLRRGMITSLLISLPQYDVQKEIANELDELSNLTKNLFDIYHQKVRKIEELRRSLLHKAFEGGL